MQIQKHKSEDLPKIQSSHHLLESLLTWSRRLFIDDDVVGRSWQDLVCIIEGSPLTVDTHRPLRIEVHVFEFGNVAALLHVSCVAAGAEDAADLAFGIGVC